MSATIRAVYDKEPTFPATDQHPSAVRYQVGGKWVDSIGGKPSQGELDAVLSPTDPNAALVAKVADESITHGDLVKLLKALSRQLCRQRRTLGL